MGKIWNINVNDEVYKIQLKSTKVNINGKVFKLKTLLQKSSFIKNEYELPIGSKKALLVTGGLTLGTNLYIDGVDCISGKQYEPLVLPKWAYIFMVLHLLNLLNGVLGGLMALIGIWLTTYIAANKKMNTAIKVFLSILILILAGISVFCIALMVAAVFGV